MLDGVCLQLWWQHRLHKILQIGSEHQGKGSSSPLCEHSQQKRSYASQGGHRFRYFELQAWCTAFTLYDTNKLRDCSRTPVKLTVGTLKVAFILLESRSTAEGCTWGCGDSSPLDVGRCTIYMLRHSWASDRGRKQAFEIYISESIGWVSFFASMEAARS